ncbi:MAG: hypothetical protein A2096_01875 [Spirochaetes bacterium GWF1_41_5]|nr:MAG: hypothetical protein A2096_01875 [Spirochaetes bacterium GWF1_41_5]HBE01920.1 hypothetical protein [Spirochaetia bacterium]
MKKLLVFTFFFAALINALFNIQVVNHFSFTANGSENNTGISVYQMKITQSNANNKYHEYVFILQSSFQIKLLQSLKALEVI